MSSKLLKPMDPSSGIPLDEYNSEKIGILCIPPELQKPGLPTTCLFSTNNICEGNLLGNVILKQRLNDFFQSKSVTGDNQNIDDNVSNPHFPFQNVVTQPSLLNRPYVPNFINENHPSTLTCSQNVPNVMNMSIMCSSNVKVYEQPSTSTSRDIVTNMGNIPNSANFCQQSNIPSNLNSQNEPIISNFTNKGRYYHNSSATHNTGSQNASKIPNFRNNFQYYNNPSETQNTVSLNAPLIPNLPNDRESFQKSTFPMEGFNQNTTNVSYNSNFFPEPSFNTGCQSTQLTSNLPNEREFYQKSTFNMEVGIQNSVNMTNMPPPNSNYQPALRRFKRPNENIPLNRPPNTVVNNMNSNRVTYVQNMQPPKSMTTQPDFNRPVQNFMLNRPPNTVYNMPPPNSNNLTTQHGFNRQPGNIQSNKPNRNVMNHRNPTTQTAGHYDRQYNYNNQGPCNNRRAPYYKNQACRRNNKMHGFKRY